METETQEKPFVQVSTRIPPEHADILQLQALVEKRSLSNMLAVIIDRYIAQKGN